MNWFEPHISKLRVCLEEWLHPENPFQQEAVAKTVDGGFFSREEVQLQLASFRRNLAEGDLEHWAEMHGMSDNRHAKHLKVLCLHAGNLPMVGMQDAVASILSGADYFGKISRKDPYLLPSFLDSVNMNGIRNARQWSLDLADFKKLKADRILFAGSTESVQAVKKSLEEHQLLAENPRYLIRTAKTSIAYAEEITDEIRDAMFLYNGRGCRSVGIVVSPRGLKEVKDAFDTTQAVQHPKADYLKAYYQALEKSFIETKGKLIVESRDFPEEDYLIHWIPGWKEDIPKLQEQFGDRVQTVYADGDENFEALSRAQSPRLYWKPDGMDVLESILS